MCILQGEKIVKLFVLDIMIEKWLQQEIGASKKTTGEIIN